MITKHVFFTSMKYNNRLPNIFWTSPGADHYGAGVRPSWSPSQQIRPLLTKRFTIVASKVVIVKGISKTPQQLCAFFL